LLVIPPLKAMDERPEELATKLLVVLRNLAISRFIDRFVRRC
jgi:hypothetical protein